MFERSSAIRGMERRRNVVRKEEGEGPVQREVGCFFLKIGDL